MSSSFFRLAITTACCTLLGSVIVNSQDLTRRFTSIEFGSQNASPNSSLAKIYIPSFIGPRQQGTWIPDQIGLFILRALTDPSRPDLPNARSESVGIVRDDLALPEFDPEEAIRSASATALNPELVVWGKLYPIDDNAVVQIYVSLGPHFKQQELTWSISNGTPGANSITLDFPNHHFPVDPFVIRNREIANNLQTFRSNSGLIRVLQWGAESAQLEIDGSVKALPLGQYSENYLVPVNLSAALVRIHHGDWKGTIEIIEQMLKPDQIVREPQSLLVDLLLLRGLAEEKQGKSGIEYFERAEKINPLRSTSVQYLVMGQLAQLQRALWISDTAQRTGAVRRYLRDRAIMFDENDPWYDGAVKFLEALDRSTQVASADPNAAPDPYRMQEGWAQLPAGRKFGAAIKVQVDHSDGKSIWVFDRCGSNSCSNSMVPPIQKFDASGKFVRAFGAGMFNQPHGSYVDNEGNVWVADQQAKNGKGDIVVKFSPQGQVLMTLGKPGMPGDGPDFLNGASSIVVAPNGDIYVGDGHGVTTNDRVVKFDKNGKFITAWGQHGKAPSEFDQVHGIALDSQGRVFVADRGNNRIQIFDPNGKFITEWKQFGRPSDVSIDKNDMIYVTDSQSTPAGNPGFKQGIRIGSAKDGKVRAFIAGSSLGIGAPGGVSVDDAGNVYGGWDTKSAVWRFYKGCGATLPSACNNLQKGGLSAH